MAFWDDWDLDLQVAGLTLAAWSVIGLLFFKAPMIFGTMDNVVLFGMPWKIFKVVAWVVSLVPGYFLAKYLWDRQD